MEKVTFASNFWVAPSKARKNGEAPINMTITLNGERASFSTHKMVLPANWDNIKELQFDQIIESGEYQEKDGSQNVSIL